MQCRIIPGSFLQSVQVVKDEPFRDRVIHENARRREAKSPDLSESQESMSIIDTEVGC